MSKIEWTGQTWNPIVGCSVVSPGCTNCYAMTQAARIERMSPDLGHYQGLTQTSKAGPVWTGKVALAGDDKLLEPLRRRRPTTYFVNSMSDLFHENVPEEWIDRVFAVMALCRQHTFQILTKRAKRMREYCSDPRTIRRVYEEVCDVTMTLDCKVLLIAPGTTPSFAPETVARNELVYLDRWPLPNVWLGVSAEDQKRADERVPELLATPAAVRFVSAEPLLGPIDFSEWMKGRAHGDSKERRGNRVPARAGGGTDDRPGGADMAPFGATSGSLDREDESHPLRGTAASRTRHREISHREGDDRREADDSLRTQAGLAPFQRPDPERIDSQSQGRSKEDQSSVELGTSDTFRTDDSRDRGLGLSTGAQLSWVIVGGESGGDARPMHPAWARAIRDQCADAGVPFFFKQWGLWGPSHAKDAIMIGGATMKKFRHKESAGRLLDGQTYDAMPRSQA